MPANAYKSNPVTQEYETRAKNLLKGELKRRGLTYRRAGGEAGGDRGAGDRAEPE